MSSIWNLKEKSQGELKVTLSGDTWKKAQEKAFNKISKNVKIDGFRPGQAPKAMIKKMVSEQQILMEAVDSVVPTLYPTALEEHNLWPVARPEVKIEKVDAEEVVIVYEVTVKPEVKLGDYQGLTAEKESVEVTEEEVNAQLETLRQRHTELVVKEGAVENGDTAVIDFEGFKDGVAFEGGKGENYPLEIGSNTFIPGFEEQLIGMNVNEEKDITVTFPENYGQKDLAGQEVVFKIKLHEVKSKVLPELNDEFVKDVNMENINTLDELKADITTRLENSKKQQAEAKFVESLLKQVVDNSEVDIPEVMIETEMDEKVREFEQRLAQQGLNLEMYTKFSGQDKDAIRENFRKDAEETVRLRLVVEAVAVKENLEVSDEEVDAEFKLISEMYNMPIEKIREIADMNLVKYDLRQRKAVNLIKDSSK